MRDKTVEKLIKKEIKRQQETLDLIASENFVSRDVREALGSVLTNKYAEGYPHARYYAGNAVADEIEDLAKARALKVFHLNSRKWSVNVQPYSGSPANLAVYLALVPPGEKIMGMRLDMGGHLTHGHKVSFTGKLWRPAAYGVDRETEVLDYSALKILAKKEKPFLIVAGYTAYPRLIDFKKFREIADASGAILMVDLSHLAGLVAGGVYPSPFPYADIVTTTTHKTLRGPRAALIFSKNEFSSAINKAVFPGLQGGPHLNQIAAVAVALGEAARPDFKKYAKQIVKNAKALALALQKSGWRVVSGGTDSHLLLLDTWRRGLGGKTASDKLEAIGVVANKNAVPYEERSPIDPSGIRLGTAALTTRGMKEKEMKKIAVIINAVLLNGLPPAQIKKEVQKLCRAFPVS